ncbi:MAG: hypothetical protein ACK4PR_06895, partial [Gammaproteobacteria bacterium]
MFGRANNTKQQNSRYYNNHVNTRETPRNYNHSTSSNSYYAQYHAEQQPSFVSYHSIHEQNQHDRAHTSRKHLRDEYADEISSRKRYRSRETATEYYSNQNLSRDLYSRNDRYQYMEQLSHGSRNTNNDLYPKSNHSTINRQNTRNIFNKIYALINNLGSYRFSNLIKNFKLLTIRDCYCFFHILKKEIKKPSNNQQWQNDLFELMKIGINGLAYLTADEHSFNDSMAEWEKEIANENLSKKFAFLLNDIGYIISILSTNTSNESPICENSLVNSLPKIPAANLILMLNEIKHIPIGNFDLNSVTIKGLSYLTEIFTGKIPADLLNELLINFSNSPKIQNQKSIENCIEGFYFLVKREKISGTINAEIFNKILLMLINLQPKETSFLYHIYEINKYDNVVGKIDANLILKLSRTISYNLELIDRWMRYIECLANKNRLSGKVNADMLNYLLQQTQNSSFFIPYSLHSIFFHLSILAKTSQLSDKIDSNIINAVLIKLYNSDINTETIANIIKSIGRLAEYDALSDNINVNTIDKLLEKIATDKEVNP